MLNCQTFFSLLKDQDIEFFTGVPDSLLKHLCAYITDQVDSHHHIIAANEGNAIGIATGYHLATGKVAMVYLQNSGLGNMINPLTSLAAPEVYSIPMLLVVGWRGQPGSHDEPQHMKMGAVQGALLDAIGISYAVLPPDIDEARLVVENACVQAKTQRSPFALVVPEGSFEPYEMTLNASSPLDLELTREDAIRLLISKWGENDVIISTTGKTSRELFELRETLESPGHQQDFLTVGSMGHASSIALGVALSQPHRTVWCLDGDGALIMHMGNLGIIGQTHPDNLRHVLLNNFSHDSVGGQPTSASNIDFTQVAAACGYASTLKATNQEELLTTLGGIKAMKGPLFFEIQCHKGARKDLGRPTTTPIENKQSLMKHLMASARSPRSINTSLFTRPVNTDA